MHFDLYFSCSAFHGSRDFYNSTLEIFGNFLPDNKF
jgi:hypothetical protein